MILKEAILRVARENPTASTARIAELANCSKRWVRNVIQPSNRSASGEVKEVPEHLKEIRLLQQQIDQLVDRKKYNTRIASSERIRFGYLTDTHCGSTHDDFTLIRSAYDIFEKEGIDLVLHSGDICDGEKMWKGHEYEIRIHGADDQVNYLCENWPEVEGIRTCFITGNHDLSFYKNSGTDIGKRIAEYRKDFEYLGPEEADVYFDGVHGQAKVRLAHPGGGSAYAVSYKMQKYIESLSGGEKPHIILMGHFHKSEFLPACRNVCGLEGGTLEHQTRFMRSKQLEAHVGFWIVEFNIDSENGINRFRPEWYGFYK